MRRATLLLATCALFGCQGASKLDLTTLGRDSWQRPSDVIEALNLQQGDRVADLGAGKGYFVTYLSETVGEDGTVYAVDVEDQTVAALTKRFPPGASNVQAVLASFDDATLPDGSVDLVLIVNTYHHIEDRPGYFRRLKRDLVPSGRVAVIEPNQDLRGVLALALDEGHTSSAAAVEEEMRQAGYRVAARYDFLPVQIFRVFVPAEADAEVR